MFCTLLHFTAFFAGVHALWPLPTSSTTGSTALRLSPGFAITPDFENVPQDLWDAVERTIEHLYGDQLGRLVVGRGASDVDAFKNAPYLSQLTLSLAEGSTVLSITEEAQKPLKDRDEGYNLTIPNDGTPAKIIATSTLGLFRGLTTFDQVWYTYDKTIYALEMPQEISDKPQYPYRGLLLDTARNYLPVPDLLRTFDAMSMVKLNQFSWHITDSTSFPLMMAGFEELAQYGAYSATEVYTAADVAQLVSYAGARGIDIMPEIDTPGHTAVIGMSHPDFIACHDESPWATYANEPPAGQLRFTNETVALWTASLFSELAKMFPSSMISTGGDEVNAVCYDDDPETQYDLNSTKLSFNDALAKFTALTHGALAAAGKTPAVWEEQVLDYNLTLSNNTIVMVWISSDDVAAVAEKGFPIVHAASNYFYLDCGGGGWVGSNPEGNSWCDPFKTWQYAYTFDPLANLTEAQTSLIKGGQHNLWTEQSGPENLDPIVWPRAAVSAEIYWTGPQGNVTSALPRLHDVSFRMRRRGINSISLQPQWCALRPDKCDLTA